MPPGMTSLPVASITRPTSRGRVPGAPMAAMRSPSTATSQSPMPSGVTTCPPRITTSIIVASLTALRFAEARAGSPASLARRSYGRPPQHVARDPPPEPATGVGLPDEGAVVDDDLAAQDRHHRVALALEAVPDAVVGVGVQLGEADRLPQGGIDQDQVRVAARLD